MLLKNRFMNKSAQLELQEQMARGGMENKKEIREKTIRVRKSTYEELRKIGVMGMDFDDVITKLIKEHYNKQR